MSSIITLIGYRGCGKSSVGPLLAQRLQYDCVDSDDEIERVAGKSISDIFADDGEATFRRMETDVLNNLFSRRSLVVAAGGGAILSDLNRQRMKEAGPVVWLQASAETLTSRIQHDESSDSRRPSLTGKSVLEEVADVLKSRLAQYSDASTIIVDADAGTPDEITDVIVSKIGSEFGEPA